MALATQGAISWSVSLAAVGGGIAAGDIGLYGLGLAATRVHWVRRRFVGGRSLWAREQLVTRLPSAVLLARVIPGLRLVTYTACGFVRVPLLRFSAWVLLAVALWTLGLYFASVAVGSALAKHLGLPLPVAVALPILALALAVPMFRQLRQRFQNSNAMMTMSDRFPATPSADRESFLPARPLVERPHRGMPPFEQGGQPLSFFEFWPMWAFYPPVMLYAGWLMIRYRGATLPTVANPSFPGGGFFGESKAEILQLAVQHVTEWVAPFVRIDRPETAAVGVDVEVEAALAELADAGISLPVVAKPDLGCRGAGVKLIRTEAHLASYIAAFPRGASLLLQRLVPFEGEAGIFYCRRPGKARGRIVSITLKYFPYAIGDGVHTLRELILADPRAGKLSHLYLKRHTARLDDIPGAGRIHSTRLCRQPQPRCHLSQRHAPRHP